MDRNKRCVLLVDDEQNILNALQRELYDWAGERSLEILTAISAREGLDILKTRGSDTVIVISDLKMPEMKGSDFLLKVKEVYPEIVSILLTGFSETNEIVKAVQAGIFSFMLKPWDSKALIAEITKAFEFSEMRRQNAEYLSAIAEELKWAGELQKAILKPNLPRSDGVEFRVSYRPLHGMYCGGDYYDVILLGPERYLLLIGDVAGHGVKAAFVTGILKAIIYSEYVRTTIGKEFYPGAFLGWLNERMNFEFRSAPSMIITFLAGVLDLKNLEYRYANAGHNHPFIIHGGKPIELPVSGSAIGFADSISYAEKTVEIESGDIINCFTDGLSEIGCSEGERPPLKIGNILESVEYGSDYHRRILDSALAASGAEDFTDDVTILTAKVP